MVRIHKSQGQTLVNFVLISSKIYEEFLEDKVGVYLPTPPFCHGQLYVALSRVSRPEDIKVLALGPTGRKKKTTKNIVFRQVMQIK